ncbi:hypothetical protein GCM10011586_23740 [Silvibacterium dinghuense]|nr:hypothetical protein GCM10011586_23740 [Silvibacterium dinghuense]
MHDDQREPVASHLFGLPVAMAEQMRRSVYGFAVDHDWTFDLEQQLFRFRQGEAARDEVAGEGLDVAVAQAGIRHKGLQPRRC